MLINGKTPEQVKNALRICNTVGNHCRECPYNGTCLDHAPEIDALALITYLEQRIEKQNALLALMGITIPEDNKND